MIAGIGDTGGISADEDVPSLCFPPDADCAEVTA